MDLGKVIRLLNPLLIDGVLSAKKHSSHRLVEMLHELQFITRSVEKTTDQVIIELQILDTKDLFQLLAGEANKFLLASRVSYERSAQTQLNNASWQTIENYYAAYYGLHYLLRITGTSVTNIDTRGTRSIEQSTYSAPTGTVVPGGLYFMKYDNASQILKLTKNLKKSGGSHQDAWLLWTQLVEQLHQRTETDPVEYSRVAMALAEHKRFLLKSTGKYNPPEIRGEINYQFKGGSWVFEKNAAKSIGILQRSISSTQTLVSSEAFTPDGMVINNRIIIELAKAVFMTIAEKYPRSVSRSLSNKYSCYLC